MQVSELTFLRAPQKWCNRQTDQGVVTPFGPVLISATAVKMVKTEIKEWSSGQGLAGAALVDGQESDMPKLANYQGLTRYHWSTR